MTTTGMPTTGMPITGVPITGVPITGVRRLVSLLLAAAVCATLAAPLCAAGGASPAPAAELFERGVQAYRSGDYGEAEILWRTLLADELQPDARARVAYDLGNAVWRQDRGMEAVGWYTASLRLDPRNPDAWANLELARGEAGLAPADRGDLRSTVQRLLTSITPGEGRWLTLAGAALLALALAGEALRGGALWRRLAWAALGVLGLCLAPWLYRCLSGGGDPVLIVRTPSVALRSEPRQDLPAVEAVPAGSELERIDALPGWVRLEAPDGTRGWVAEDAVFPLSR